MKVYPMHDRLLVKRDETDGVSKGGIILPDGSKEKPLRGVVVGVGPGKRLEAPLSPTGFVRAAIEFNMGDHVLFAKYAGDSYSFNGEELFLVKEEDILAVLVGVDTAEPVEEFEEAVA